MTTYVVALSKGGSTKTTTATEIAVALTKAGRRVLAVDLDQQGSFTRRLGLYKDAEVDATATEVLTGEATAKEAAVPSPSLSGAHVVVGTHSLNSLESRPEIITSLRDHLPDIAEDWDDVVIDTPPALGFATHAGLTAADVVVAAVACQTEAYDQLDRLSEFIQARVAAPRLRPGLQIHWVVPTLFDKRRLLDKEIVELLKSRFPGRVTSTVSDRVAVKDSYTAAMPISVYDPSSPAALEFAAAIAPIISPSTEEAA